MKNKKSFEKLKSLLISLGFAFYGEPYEIADPEATLIEAIKLSISDTKVFRMLLAWLEKTRELIHVERLRTLAKDLSQGELVVLGVVALKQVRAGDRRFLILVHFSKEHLKSKKSKLKLFAESADPYLISKYGLDKELAEFDVRVAKINAANKRKILSLQGILKQHPWLRFRALIGANFRADIAYMMAHKTVQNPYRAAKKVGCSQETAHRLWKGLSQFPKIELLAT